MPWRRSSCSVRPSGRPHSRQQFTLALSPIDPAVPATRMAASPPSSSSPPPHIKQQEDAAAAAVCCMCGDHGLPRELFRCKACRVRLQHSYCSDLYPRATAYARCNWCLREPPPAAGQQGGAAAAAGYAYAAEANKRSKQVATDGVVEERLQHRHEGLSSPSSRRAPAGAYYPVKKKRKADDDEDERATSAAADEDAGVKLSCRSNDAGKNKSKEELMRAGTKAPRARAKVRRYRLLAEVISC